MGGGGGSPRSFRSESTLFIPYKSLLLAKFTFLTIASWSTLNNGPYLFYIEKFTTQFNTTKKMIGHQVRFRENYDLPL